MKVSASLSLLIFLVSLNGCTKEEAKNVSAQFQQNQQQTVNHYLSSEISWIRQDAAQTLGQKGLRNDSNLRKLQKLLSDKDSSVRIQAIVSIRGYKEDAIELAHELTLALSDKNANVRREAGKTLGEIGLIGSSKENALISLRAITLSKDEYPDVKDAAQSAIVSMGK